VVEILFNQKSLEKLPDNYRAAIDQAGWDAFLRTVALSPQWDEVGYQTCREKNIEIIDLAPEAVNQFRKATLPLWDEIASKSEVSAKLVDSLKHYLTQKGIQMD
jgi:TRAP-type C4-dicarboxylate transport system substrate-binding protein